jgi:DNA (cytosine-5)-methyltransferase 1
VAQSHLASPKTSFASNLQLIHNVDITKTITHLSLCSGYEGIGLGLRELFPSLHEIAYVEREAFCATNLVAKMESGHLAPAPVFTDVRTFPYEKFRGKVDILSGGFPCQPFSVAGTKKGVEDPRHLFPYIARGIRQCQPAIVFLENVEGIISAKTAEGESVLRYVLRELESMGYNTTAGLFTACETGAPHQRKRVFIMGYAEHLRPHGSEVTRGSTTAVRDLTQGENPTSQPSGAGAPKELAHESDSGRGGRTNRDGGNSNIVQKQAQDEQPILRSEAAGCCGNTGGTEELAHSHDADAQGRLPRGTSAKRQGFDGHLGCSSSSIQRRWVARPNQEQYEWEEPRVKPCVGRTTDGYSSRVDRLRLLGNGVVPHTAITAFTTLLNRLI